MVSPAKSRTKRTNEPEGMELPRDREFLGLVDNGHTRYWDFFWYATKDTGSNGPSCYLDRSFFDMPKILGWIEVPELEVE